MLSTGVQDFKEPPPLTPEERKRADHSAVLSMLWLHYAHGWPVERIASDIVGRLFGGDPVRAVEAAKEIYPREFVLAWMEDQKRAGN